MKTKMNIWNYAILIIISVFLITPLMLTFFYSIFTEWTSILPTDFTVKYYMQVLSDHRFLSALSRSIIVSLAAVSICTISMLFVLYTIQVYIPKLEKYIEILCNIPYAMQGVILAVGIISLYAGKPGFLSNRIVLLIGAYCIMILPYMYRGLKNTMSAVNIKCILEAAQVLGCSKIYAFLVIVIPQMKKGIISTMMLAFTMLFADFALVNLIAGSAYQTAGIYLYQTISKSGQLSSTIIVILFIFTLLVSTLTLMLQNKTMMKGRK